MNKRAKGSNYSESLPGSLRRVPAPYRRTWGMRARGKAAVTSASFQWPQAWRSASAAAASSARPSRATSRHLQKRQSTHTIDYVNRLVVYYVAELPKILSNIRRTA